MVERQLVERRDSATDRRVVEVHTAARAHELFDAAKARRRDHLREILARVDEQRLAGLLDGLRAVRTAREEIEREQDDGPMAWSGCISHGRGRQRDRPAADLPAAVPRRHRPGAGDAAHPGASRTLYLPNLNADIIDKGIATGDTAVHPRGRRADARRDRWSWASRRSLAVYWGAKVAMGFGRDLRAAIFGRSRRFSQVEVNRFGPASLITRNTNDVQQVQTVVFMGLTVIVVGADDDHRRHHPGGPRGRRAVPAAARRSCR